LNNNQKNDSGRKYALDSLFTEITSNRNHTAEVSIIIKGYEKPLRATGKSYLSVIDAALKAIDEILDVTVDVYMCECHTVKKDGHFYGKAITRVVYQDIEVITEIISSDIVIASVKAYLMALEEIINQMTFMPAVAHQDC
jgi:hypothetical protein